MHQNAIEQLYQPFSLSLRNMRSSEERARNSRAFYFATKKLLSQHGGNPTLKRSIFDYYIQTWLKFSCGLNIKNLESDTVASIGDLVPMIVDFDLSDVDFTGFNSCDLKFTRVDFNGANFTKTKFTYSSFTDCDFTNVRVSNSNLNQCEFSNCIFKGVDLSQAELSHVAFRKCYLCDTGILKSTHYYTIRFDNCLGTDDEDEKKFFQFMENNNLNDNGIKVTDVANALVGKMIMENYEYRCFKRAFELWAKHHKIHVSMNEVEAYIKSKPSFLRLPLRKIHTPQQVAHALWLRQNDKATTAQMLNHFSVWARHKKLPFGNDDVQEVLEKTYVMQ